MNPHRQALDELCARRPHAAGLASLASLAARIEPSLLRGLRRQLLPAADPSAEADLWFSRLIQARSASYAVLHPAAAELLRRDLARDPRLLEDAWKATRAIHASAPPAIRLEEEITFLSLKGDLAAAERCLQSAVAALRQPGREGLAYWAAGAIPRLPESIRHSKSAWLLALSSAARMDGPPVLAGDPPPEVVDSLPSILPAHLRETVIGVRVAAGSLEFSDPPAGGSQTLAVPRTLPILLNLEWGDSQPVRQSVSLMPGERRVVEVAAPEVRIHTVGWQSHTLRRKAPPPRVTPPSPAKRSVILSIRGGGIRGIIPCCLLVTLEEQMGGLTRDHIDFCAGASTSALLAAGIAAGVPAAQLLEAYTSSFQKVFSPGGVLADAKFSVNGYRYDAATLHTLWMSLLGSSAAWVLNDAPIGILLSAAAMDGHEWFFVRDGPQNAGTTGKVKLVDAAVASCCTPTYFPPWTIAGIAGRTLTLFDSAAGGTSNPAYQACVEAFAYDSFDSAHTSVISLGTGYYPQSQQPPSGLPERVRWMINTLTDSSEDWIDQAVQRQWPGIYQTYNLPLPSKTAEDDLSAVPLLVQIGQQLAADIDWRQILAAAAAGSQFDSRAFPS